LHHFCPYGQKWCGVVFIKQINKIKEIRKMSRSKREALTKLILKALVFTVKFYETIDDITPVGMKRISLQRKIQHCAGKNIKIRPYRLEKAIGRLKDKELVVVDEDFVYLSKSGLNKGLIENIEHFIKRPKKWDKLWRVIIFDIPVEKNKARTALRRKFQEIGFYQIQKSVFVYPYPCEKEIMFIGKFFGVEKFIEIILAKNLGRREDKIKKFFEL